LVLGLTHIHSDEAITVTVLSACDEEAVIGVKNQAK
jgi:hypothetical protein